MNEVSVILPCFNAERFLEAALSSLLNQSFTEFDIIAFDDGSEDTTFNILQLISRNDSRVKCFRRENRGLIATLNEAVEETSSRYLVRMDADDICHPDRLKEQFFYMSENQDCVASGSRVTLIDEDGDEIKDMGDKVSHTEIDAAHLAGQGGAIIHPASIIRRSAFVKIGGYREEFSHAEDIDLFLRLGEIGKLANIDKSLLYYRQHLSSIGYQKRELQSRSTKAAVESAIVRRNVQNQIAIPKLKNNPREVEVYRKWGWWAYNAGNIFTAKKYALKGLKENPFDIENLKLFYCAFLKA